MTLNSPLSTDLAPPAARPFAPPNGFERGASAGTDAGAPFELPIADCQLPIDPEATPPASNRQLAIGNRQSSTAPAGLDPRSASPSEEAGALHGAAPCPAAGARPLPIADCQLPIEPEATAAIFNRQSAIVNRQSATLTDYQMKIANRRLALCRRYDELKSWHDQRGIEISEISLSGAASLLGEPISSLWSALQLWLPDRCYDDLIPPRPRGRTPKYQPADAEIQCVKEIYVRLDESRARGRGLGSSKFAACRLAAKGNDPRITDDFRALMLGRDRRSLPPSLFRALDTPASVLARARDKRSTLTTYVSTPRGRTWVDENGRQLPTRPGDCLSADDGTLNFYAWIPWPFGGDKCSDRFGVKLGRWQLLVVVDDRSEFCVAFDIVARQSSAYGGADVAALTGRAMIEILKPNWWLLERGSWESDHVKRGFEIADVRVKRAWESKQKSAVERFFDRAWTPLSLVPGHSGRDRGRFKQMTDLALACQAGRRDPREFGFLSLTEAAPRVAKAIEFTNQEPMESRSGWGRWVPEERFRAALQQEPPVTLPPTLSIFFAREQRVKTVRAGGVGFSVECPEVRFPVFFQCEQLWEFEGCEVKCFFDPYADPVLGTITLHDAEWRGYKRGHIIAREVPALDLPPQAIFDDGWTSESAERSLAIRKAIAKAVRTETWNYLGARSSHARDGMGNTASRNGTSNVQLPTSNVERSKFDVGRSAFDVQPPSAAAPRQPAGHPAALPPPRPDHSEFRRLFD